MEIKISNFLQARQNRPTKPLEAMPGSAGRALVPVGGWGRRSPACLSSVVKVKARMSELASIFELWEKRPPIPPSLLAAMVDGKDFFALDDQTAGCIFGFLCCGTRNQTLTPDRLNILQNFSIACARISPELSAEDRIYSDTLREVCERIVRYCRRSD